MRWKFAEVMICVLMLGAGRVAGQPNDDAAGLLAQAKASAERNDMDTALARVAKAEGLLQGPGDAVQRAKVLDYHVYLLMVRSRKGPNPDDDGWRPEALPLAKQALDILEQDKLAHEDEFATAVETEAEALGATQSGRDLWAQSAVIRKRRVEERKPCVDTGGKFKPAKSESTPSKYQRSAVFRMVVNKKGLTEQIKLVRGVGFGLDECGAEALSHWTFKPGIKNGRPTSVPATVKFALEVFWPAVDDPNAVSR